MNKYYVYLHRRARNGLPFYVGKGSEDRAWRRSNRRNSFWKRTVAKHGYSVEICQDGMIEPDAFLLEMWLIAKLRHEGFPMTNLTDGGEGNGGKVCNSRITVFCSNGQSFVSSQSAADWVTSIRGNKSFSNRIYLCARGSTSSAYGFNWSFDGFFTDNQFNATKERTARFSIAVSSSMGEEFHSALAAATYLRSNGYPKADSTAIVRVLDNSKRIAYGRKWTRRN